MCAIKEISIFTGSTEQCVKKFKSSFPLYASEDDILFARVYYNTSILTRPDQNPHTFPLVIRTKEYAFCLGDVSAGYGGTGPHGTVEVLKWLGFKFNEEEIYQKRTNGITSLKFNRVA